MANGDTKTNQYLDIAANGTRADLPSDTCCETRTQSLIRGVAERVMDVEDEVERLENNPDVVDIVATYADLQAYDTSTLTDKDVIRVLTDSTHNNNSTFYRWNAATSQFDYIGEVTSGPTVVQTTGTSTTDVMSQNATTNMVYGNADRPTSQHRSVILGGAYSPLNTDNIGIGYHANPGSTSSGSTDNISLGQTSRVNPGKSWGISIGYNSYAGGNYGTSIGSSSSSSADNGLSIGHAAKSTAQNAVAVGYGSNATEVGQFDISTGVYQTSGYNSSNYRLLTGLYDPQNSHDAATKGYVDNAVAGAGGGEAKLLTSDDYDYPDADPTGVALWRLPSGMYYTKQGTSVFFSTIDANINEQTLIISNPQDYNYYTDIIRVYSAGGDSTYIAYKTVKSTGQPGGHSNIRPLFTDRIVQTTGTSTSNIMSQKAVTDIVGNIEAALNVINNGTGA